MTGREAAAAELFAASVAYYEKLQKSGKLASFEPFFLAPHGGDLNGFFLLKGTHQNLDWIRTDDGFMDLQLRAGHILEGLGLIQGYTGATINELMQRWIKSAPR